MVKTNYTKVDGILENQLRRMTVEHDLKENIESVKENANEPPDPNASAIDKVQQRLIAALKRDLQKLHLANHREMYASLDMKKSDLKKKIESPEKLTPEEWETIKQIKAKIDKYRSELKEKLPQQSDDAIVEAQRNKHVNKRFNVNEKWLPLH